MEYLDIIQGPIYWIMNDLNDSRLWSLEVKGQSRFIANNLVQDGHRELRQKFKSLNNSEYDFGRMTDAFKKERSGHNDID